jgi:hypothetical protein
MLNEYITNEIWATTVKARNSGLEAGRVLPLSGDTTLGRTGEEHTLEVDLTVSRRPEDLLTVDELADLAAVRMTVLTGREFVSECVHMCEWKEH